MGKKGMNYWNYDRIYKRGSNTDRTRDTVDMMQAETCISPLMASCCSVKYKVCSQGESKDGREVGKLQMTQV